MQRCPRGCRPASPLAGAIDEGPVNTDGFLHVWIRTDGEDLFCKRGHEECARREMKRFGTPGKFPIIDALQLGWIRLSAFHGSTTIELGAVPTPEQTSTLDKYLRTPGFFFRIAELRGGVRPQRLNSDGFTRMTAGRIAAWAAQALEPRAALGGHIDTAASVEALRHTWIAPDGTDHDAGFDHGTWALKLLTSAPLKRKLPSSRMAVEHLLDQGWIRVFAPGGQAHIELRRPMTRPQVHALQKYLRFPGVEFGFAEIGMQRLTSDGFQRITAGRIAAWAAQVLR